MPRYFLERGFFAALRLQRLVLATALLPLASSASPTLKVGYGRVVPITYKEKNGMVAGFAVDVLTEAARREGIGLTWVPTPGSAGSEEMLADGLIDLMAAGMVTPGRQRRFFVSEPWWSDELSMLTRADLNHPVERIAMSPVYESVARKAYPRAVFFSEGFLEDYVSAVCSGKADGVLIAHGDLRAVSLKRTPACAETALDAAESPVVTELAVISRRSDQAVARRLRERIDEMAIDGSLIRFAGKHPPLPASGVVQLADRVAERSRVRILSLAAFLLVPFAVWAALGLRRPRKQSPTSIRAPETAPSRTRRYLFAVAVMLAAMGVRYVLMPVIGLRVPFMFQSFAVAAAAQYGGMAAGFLATVIAVLLGGFVFPGPTAFGFFPRQPADALGLAFFMMLGVLLSFLGERFVTAKRQHLEAERNSEAERRHKDELEAVLESMAEPLMIADACGNIVTTNRSYRTAYGAAPKSVSDFEDQFTLESVDGEKLPLEMWPINRALRGEAVHNQELNVLGKDGTRWRVNVNAVPVHDAGGTLSQILVTCPDVGELRRAGEALRESQERFRIVQELSPDGFTILRPVRDQDGRVTDFAWVYENAAAGRLNGTDPEAVVGRRLLEVCPERRGTEFHTAYTQVAETGEQRIFEAEFSSDRAATPRWLRIVVVSMGGDIAVFTQDITGRMQSEDAIRKSEARLQTVLENVGEGVVLATESGRIFYWNPAAVAMHGYGGRKDVDRRIRDLVGKFRLSFSDGRVLPVEDWPISRLLRGEEFRNLEVCLRRLDQGWERTVSYSGSLLETANGERLALVSIYDLTDQRKAEEALRRSEAKYRAVFRALVEGVVFLNPKGEIEEANDAVARTEGKPDPRERIVRPDGSPFPVEEQPAMVALRTGQAVRDIEMGVPAAGGDLRWRLVNAQPVKDEQGNVLGAVASFFDITDRKRSEERLRHAQKLESIGLLAGGIAHDFNNLLTGIMGNASLAMEHADAETAGILEAVVGNAERAAHLTRQLLAYSGKGQFFVRDLDLSGSVREMGDFLRMSVPKNVELRFDLQERLPLVKIDPGQLQQLVMNLVINAGEAIGDSRAGSIAVSTRVCRLRTATVDAIGGELPPGKYVCIEVSDNGPGIDEAARSRIFDPFFTTKFTGRGLGLAAVSGIMRALQGGITLAGGPGEGTRFTLYFPLAAADPHQGPRETILVVDDEEYVREFLRLALEAQGYRVLLAADGADALRVWDGSQDEPDLVILDVVIPVMAANELMPEVRRRRPDLKVLLTSGYNEEEARRLAAECGGASFIQKPYTAQRLAEVVAEILRPVGEAR